MANHCRLFLVTLTLASLLLSPGTARADIAPPESPSGGNPSPGEEVTQVRMLSETVTLAVKEKSPQSSLGQAEVQAVFEMQNTGSADEIMEVRFPLTFPDGRSDGFGNFPEIKNLKVRVDGRNQPTRRANPGNPGRSKKDPLPWAAFEATFPAGRTVEIVVTYEQKAWGEYPYIVFGYVLETGAGWQGTIGNAELVVRLPYEVNEQNVIFEDSVGFGDTSPGAEIAGNELRWQRSDFEPGYQDNLSVLMISPETWKKIQAERESTRQNPEDGEAWGRLGKACKETSRLRKGFRQDSGGLALYQESLAAYEKAVELKPEDALWHYGYADLLWSHYLFHVYSPYAHDLSELLKAVQELKASLDLDPDGPQALELAQEIAWWEDGLIDLESDPIAYLLLTATPVYPTQEPTLAIIEVTAIPDPTNTAPTPPPSATATSVVFAPTATPAALAQLPVEPEASPVSVETQAEARGLGNLPGGSIALCVGAFIPLLVLVAILRALSKKGQK